MNLTECFKAQIPNLRSELTGLKLPVDSEKVEKIISSNFSLLFESEGEFRQNLTQSEDYILQAALSLLHAQQEITMNLVNNQPSKQFIPTQIKSAEFTDNNRENREPNTKSIKDIKVSAQNSALGSAGGAIVGNVLFGGWGAVFGAIAGTALVIYLSSTKNSEESKNTTDKIKPKPTPLYSEKLSDSPIDVEKFIAIIGQICESVDNLIDTFRSQIKKVVTKYESLEKPTIEREYRTLLEGIQSLIGYKRGHNLNDEKYLSKLQSRVEDLAELLDNYDLEAIDYSENNSAWFDAVESEKASEIKMVYPAIVKNGQLIIKGKIFIPKQID